MSTNLSLCTKRECITARRTRVMRLLDRGLYEREVAQALGISHRTVQRYRRAEREGVIARPNRKR